MKDCCKKFTEFRLGEFIEPPLSLHGDEQNYWLACFGFSDMGGTYKETRINYCPFCGGNLNFGGVNK